MMLYEKEHDLRVSDFDKNDIVRPYGVLDLLQTVADRHATELKIGFNELIAEDFAWVLLRSKYEVIKPIGFGTTSVTVKTWPQKAGRVDYDRDYLIEVKKGEPNIIASSKWCVINIKTRKIVFGKGVVYPEDEYYPHVNFPEGLNKLPDFNLEEAQKVKGFAGASCLDHNGHVNNAKYSEFIMDALGENDKTVKTFEVNYINEMQVGEYEIYFIKNGDNRLIKGFSNGKESFRAEVSFF